MHIQELSQKANHIKDLYSEMEIKKFGKKWTDSQIMEGFVVDVGELMELMMAKDGIREVDDLDKKIAHELSDCLYSILVLAKRLNINLEQEFLKTMAQLENKLNKK